jgi:hypothetical protein
MFGYRTNLDRGLFESLAKVPGISLPRSLHDYVQKHSELQDSILLAAKEHQARVIQRRLQLINVGDKVLVRFPADRPRGKLFPKARGPMIVRKKLGSNSFELEDTIDKALSIHSTMNMRPWNDRFADVNQNYAAWDLQEWDVDKLVAHRLLDSALSKKRKAKSDYEFKVRWYGYTEEDDSWRGYGLLKNSAALDAYVSDKPGLKKFLGRH